VTTSSVTPGTVLLAPVTHTSAVVPTVSTLTGHTAQTGDSYAIVNSGTHGNAALKTLIDTIDNIIDTEFPALITTIGTPAGASIAADLLTIDNLVDGLESTIGAAGAGLTDLGGFSTTAKGQIQTEAEDALVVHRLDELLNADSDIDGAAPPTVGSVFHELMSKTAGSFTFDQTTDSNEALRDRWDAAWITATGFATSAALATAQTDITSILADTNELQTDLANGGRLDLLIDAILADTDSLDTTKITTARAAVLTDWIDGGRLDNILDARASQASVDVIEDLLDTEIGALQTTLNGLFTTALTESYRSAGAAPTMAQFAFETLAHLGDSAIVSTIKTLYNLAHTAAKTFTLDSASAPTSITETT
jgi:hypothetical protein